MHRDTLRMLVRAHQVEIFRYMRYLGANAALAEDLVQDTFVAAFSSRRPSDIDDVRGRAAWLRAIGRNLFLNACRRRRTSPVEVNSERIKQAEAVWASQLLRGGDGFDTVEALRKVGYSSVGTVEFLLDEKNRYYFMETNTRIQVEHPVTEMITGFDLVREQIRLAVGDKLGRKQEDISFRGKPDMMVLEMRRINR